MQEEKKYKIGETEFSKQEIQDVISSDFNLVSKNELEQKLSDATAAGLSEARQTYEATQANLANGFRTKMEGYEKSFTNLGFDKKTVDGKVETIYQAQERVIKELLGNKQRKEPDNTNDFLKSAEYVAITATNSELLSQKAELEKRVQEMSLSISNSKRENEFNSAWASISDSISNTFKDKEVGNAAKKIAKDKFLNQYDEIRDVKIGDEIKSVYFKDGNPNIAFIPNDFLSSLKIVKEITEKSNVNLGFENIVNAGQLDNKGVKRYTLVVAPNSKNQIVDHAIEQGIEVGSKEMADFKAKHTNFESLPHK